MDSGELARRLEEACRTSGAALPAFVDTLGFADARKSATNLGLLLGNSGIMPAMAEKAKQPGPMRPGAPSFGEFKITEEPEEKFG